MYIYSPLYFLIIFIILYIMFICHNKIREGERGGGREGDIYSWSVNWWDQVIQNDREQQVLSWRAEDKDPQLL